MSKKLKNLIFFLMSGVLGEIPFLAAGEEESSSVSKGGLAATSGVTGTLLNLQEKKIWFPKEMWFEIFSYLERADILSYSYASKELRDIGKEGWDKGKDSSFWKLLSKLKGASSGEVGPILRALNNCSSNFPKDWRNKNWLYKFINYKEFLKEESLNTSVNPSYPNLMEDSYWKIPQVREEVLRFYKNQEWGSNEDQHLAFMWLTRQLLEKEKDKLTSFEKKSAVNLIENSYHSYRGYLYPGNFDDLRDLVGHSLERNAKIPAPWFFQRKNFQKKPVFWVALGVGGYASFQADRFLKEKALSWGSSLGKRLKTFLIQKKWIREEGTLSSRLEPFMAQGVRFTVSLGIGLSVGLGVGQFFDKFYHRLQIRRHPPKVSGVASPNFSWFFPKENYQNIPIFLMSMMVGGAAVYVKERTRSWRSSFWGSKDPQKDQGMGEAPIEEEGEKEGLLSPKTAQEEGKNEENLKDSTEAASLNRA